jgi:ABC-type transport system involved in multi-copper enzyme maturation permease subunit
MRTIIRRELLDHFQSIHFLLLLVVSLVLFAADGIVFAGKYREQAAYYARHTSDKSALASTVRTTLYTEPGPFLFLAAAGDSRQPASYDLMPASRPGPTLFESGNLRLPEIPETDWGFIVKIVFSLYIVLLGFDAIAGEKEQGTLRQTLSHPIGRLTLLAGKYAAILLSACAAMIPGMLLSLILLQATIPSILTLEGVGRFLMFLFLSGLYLSIFTLITLMVSSLLHHSSLVLLAVLVVWVTFAIVIPNTAGVVADGLAKAPGEYSIAKQLESVTNTKMQDGFKAIADRADRGELTTQEQAQHEYDLLCNSLQEDITRVTEAYDNALNARAALARSLARLSPTALLQFAAEGVAGTGTPREEKILQDLHNYAGRYDAYVLKKVGKLVGTSNYSFAGTLDVGGKSVRVRSPYPVEYEGDKSDFPHFTQQRPSVPDGIRSALLDSVGLILWNFVLALGAAWAIARADVR